MEIQKLQWDFLGMTIEETAEALRTDVNTVRILIRERGLPARKVGRGWRIDPDAVKAWLASGTYDEQKRSDAGKKRIDIL